MRRTTLPTRPVSTALVCALLLNSCVTTGGGDSGALSGSAGTAGSEGTVELTRCPQTLGAIAISGDRIDGYYLVRFGVPQDPRPALRLILQQSGCAEVVHRDVALQVMKEERALAEAGELREGSNFEGGQMVAADFVIIPEITFSENNAGGAGAAFGTVVGAFIPFGGLLGLAAGGMRFKEAQVLLTLVDARTGVQKAVASGTASGTSFGGFGGVLGTTTLGAGGYMNTNQGKVVIAAMVDAMNNLIPHIKQQARI